MLAELFVRGVIYTLAGFVGEKVVPWRPRAAWSSTVRPLWRQRPFWADVAKFYAGGTAIYMAFELLKRFFLDQPPISGWEELILVLALPFFVASGYLASCLHSRKARAGLVDRGR